MAANGDQIIELFGQAKAVVGMVHVGALPGTPFSAAGMAETIARAVDEARLLVSFGFDGLITGVLSTAGADRCPSPSP